tara:strand:- start:350068 stop:350535 length:468 start_codon:yes stop_codon:yes gene_type:complete
MDGLTFIEVAWQSAHYTDGLDLRNRTLRLPLGLQFSSDDIQAEQHQSHYAALLDKKLVGCLSVLAEGHERVRLRQMAVEPAYQRIGIGSFLIRRVESALMHNGPTHICLHARQTAIGFYEKLGYTTSGEVFTEVTIPHVVMIKTLSGSSGDRHNV